MRGLKKARELRGLTQKAVCEQTGIPLGTLRRWEQGVNEPDVKSINLLADFYEVTTDYILGSRFADSVAAPAPTRGVDLPLVGRIAAGDPREAIEHPGETIETLASVAYEHPRAFWLRVSGNSMNRVVPDGFYVLVDPSMPVRNGDVGVVLVNGDDATMKRVYVDGGRVTLHPESYDPDYADRTIDGSSPDAPRVRMVGRVVSCRPPVNWHP